MQNNIFYLVFYVFCVLLSFLMFPLGQLLVLNFIPVTPAYCSSYTSLVLHLLPVKVKNAICNPAMMSVLLCLSVFGTRGMRGQRAVADSCSGAATRHAP